MRASSRFSLARFRAVTVKEFVQMRRDRLTFAMMVGIPLFQLILFGYAINTDPKHLPAAVLVADQGPLVRSVLNALQNSDYYDFYRQVDTESEARNLIEQGKVQFVVHIPENFSRDLLRGDRPALLIEADATDPGTTGGALNSLPVILDRALQNDLKGPLSFLSRGESPIDLPVHARYNPEAITQYNIVPGLMGVVLTMTMVLIMALAITREWESGTLENLLSMPTRPLEVLLGKISPYIIIGYMQVGLILLAARYLFKVPMQGSLALILAVSFVFIVANLAVGITFSTIARNQRQAMQMGIFFFLPQILLSGFMFPFRGMPIWARAIGEVLPLTHFLRIIRGIMLKGNGLVPILPEIWPIILFAVVALTIGVKRYRRTLD